LLREPQKGKGFALRRGFNSIRAEFTTVVVIDGDDTYGCDKLIEGIELVEEFISSTIDERRMKEGDHIRATTCINKCYKRNYF
jgi:hypothetical protein